MFYNVLKRVVQPHIQVNIKHVNNTNLQRFSSSSGGLRNDIKDALDIEANLFENSALQHEPVSTRDALRKHKPTVNKQRVASKPPPQYVTAAIQRNGHTTPNRTAPPLIKDNELGLEFTRLSLQDPMLSTLLTTARSRKRRDKDRQIIIEGRRLIREALMCGLHMESLIFSQKDQLAQLQVEVVQSQREYSTKIYKVPQHDLKTWSSLVTPPGLLAIFERPSARGLEHTLFEQQHPQTSPLPITVVCDNIREPNNLGSIIRTCAALPCTQVVVTHGCCDPWESKALRGGCGGQFRLPIRDNVTWEQLALTIPPEAADDCHVFIAENNVEKLAHKANSMDYTNLSHGKHNILIIGGESHGVSDEAYKFMNRVGDKGKCVHIPLAGGVDSLNVASAITLILFELKRKLSALD